MSAVHDTAPAVVESVPGGQLEQAVAPAREYVPAGHVIGQAPVAPGVGPAQPAVTLVQEVEPANA